MSNFPRFRKMKSRKWSRRRNKRYFKWSERTGYGRSILAAAATTYIRESLYQKGIMRKIMMVETL